MSENKTGKYFKYAIGEIILVVIGILIALQINNWNEKRQDNYKEQIYLQDIKASLITDSLRINSILKFNNKKILIVKKLMSIFSDTLNNYQRFEIINELSESFTAYEVFVPKRTTWDNLLSSERLSIVDSKELRNLLMEFYSFDFNGGVQERLKLMNRKVIDNVFPQFFTREFAEQELGLKTKLSTIKESKISQNKEFISDLYGITYLINLQNNFLSNTLNQIKTSLNLIEENLN